MLAMVAQRATGRTHQETSPPIVVLGLLDLEGLIETVLLVIRLGRIVAVGRGRAVSRLIPLALLLLLLRLLLILLLLTPSLLVLALVVTLVVVLLLVVTALVPVLLLLLLTVTTVLLLRRAVTVAVVEILVGFTHD